MKRLWSDPRSLVAILVLTGLAVIGWHRATRAPENPAGANASESPTASSPEATQEDVAAWVAANRRARFDRQEREGVGVSLRPEGVRRAFQLDPAVPAPSRPGEGLRLRAFQQPVPKAAPTAESVPPVQPEPSASPRTAPYGRPLKCSLVFTLESTAEQAPLVGLVVEDQWWDGELVVPAGTEVHGKARVDRQRDRVFSAEDWVLVLPRQEGARHGREIRLRGVALDREEGTPDGLTWGMTDGSLGLRGAVLRSTNPEEVKLFAATFLSAAAAGLQESATGVFGESRVIATPRNAALEGTRAILDELADRLAAEVKRSGSYLRVPAGKEFYLYVTQTIDNQSKPD